jgi:rhamnogalacturonyl hydrolase YesR
MIKFVWDLHKSCTRYATFQPALRLCLSVSVAILVSSGNLTAQNRDQRYRLETEALYQAIRTNFYDSITGYYKEQLKTQPQKNKASYLWPLCAIFQAANEMEIAGLQKGLVGETLEIITKYYDPRPPAPGYASYAPVLGGGDRFYDDNQWIGITLLDAYQRTSNKDFLQKGVEIYQFMMTAYDTATGGGLYWEEGKPTKNTCSNGPGIILALQLYKATGNKPYLDTALMLYNWVNDNLRDSTGLYYDNINTVTRKIDTKKYSYNTGTMLQSNVYLYEATKDDKYLKRAVGIADSATGYFYRTGKFRDNLWFNAVLLRGLIHLHQYHKDNKYLSAFRRCVDQALNQNKNANGLMGKEKLMDLVAQGGMLEILARFALIPS